jgi:hypothetical protein
MKQPSENQILMRRYLTGEVSERERDELEEKYFNDDELFGELLESEERIIDDYRRGKLAPPERERFESRFLALPDRRREVELAILFDQYLAERQAPGSSTLKASSGARSLFDMPLFAWLRAARSIPGWTLAAAAMMVVAIGLGWIAINTSKPQEQPSNITSDRAGPTPMKDRARIEEDLARLQTQPVPAKGVIPLALTRGASRGSGETNKIRPGPDTALIEFTLDAGAENYAGYQASLQKALDDSDGVLIKQLEAQTTTAGTNVMVRVPATMLETDDYRIKLEGISSQGDTHMIGEYYFQVRPQ